VQEDAGHTCVLVAVCGLAVAVMAVTDPVKPEAAAVVAALQGQVSRVLLLLLPGGGAAVAAAIKCYCCKVEMGLLLLLQSAAVARPYRC